MHPACECRGASQNATAVAERCSQVGFCAGPRGYQMEHIIDIQLVKEQLRLLGHHVADDVILAFVKGLNSSSGAGADPATACKLTLGHDRRMRTPVFTGSAHSEARVHLLLHTIPVTSCSKCIASTAHLLMLGRHCSITLLLHQAW